MTRHGLEAERAISKDFKYVAGKLGKKIRVELEIANSSKCSACDFDPATKSSQNIKCTVCGGLGYIYDSKRIVLNGWLASEPKEFEKMEAGINTRHRVGFYLERKSYLLFKKYLNRKYKILLDNEKYEILTIATKGIFRHDFVKLEAARIEEFKMQKLPTTLDYVFDQLVEKIKRKSVDYLTDIFRDAKAELHSAYQELRYKDSEAGLITFRQPNIAGFIYRSPRIVEKDKYGVKLSFLNMDALDAATIARRDITVSVDKGLGKKGKRVTIRGRTEARTKYPEYAYWRVLEYGVARSKTHVPIFFRTKGGKYGVYMRERKPRSGMRGLGIPEETVGINVNWHPRPGLRIMTKQRQKVIERTRQIPKLLGRVNN